MTASAHPVVFRPVIQRMREAGHEVSITARDYSQTLGILRIQGLDSVQIGRHAGASRTRKAAALAGRTTKLHSWARGAFDLAVAQFSRFNPMPGGLRSELVVLSDDSALAPSVRLEGGS